MHEQLAEAEHGSFEAQARLDSAQQRLTQSDLQLKVCAALLPDIAHLCKSQAAPAAVRPRTTCDLMLSSTTLDRGERQAVPDTRRLAAWSVRSHHALCKSFFPVTTPFSMKPGMEVHAEAMPLPRRLPAIAVLCTS